MLVVILKAISPNKLEFKGNAFVVNKRGLLISAGHLWDEDDMSNYYAAIPSKDSLSSLYKIRRYYLEHFDLDNPH